MDHTSNSPGKPTQPKFSWKNRRRFLITVIAFCMSVISYVLHYNLQSAVAETAVTMAFLIIGTSLGSYVFGAAWQDVSIAKSSPQGPGVY